MSPSRPYLTHRRTYADAIAEGLGPASFEPPPAPPLLERGYLDLACGCRTYCIQTTTDTWRFGRTFLCAIHHCTDDSLPLAARVEQALADGLPLTPRAHAWPEGHWWWRPTRESHAQG